MVPPRFFVMAKAEARRIDWEALARAQIHPLRLAIIEVYATGNELTPVEVQRLLGESKLGNVSYHTRALLADGFIELVRTEQRRGALAHYYQATSKLVS